MTIKNILSSTLNRFRTVSVKHPIGVVWENKNMTLYQRGLKFNINNIFEYCYMPVKKKRAIILPHNIGKFLEAQHYLDNSEESVFVVPKEWGFDIMKPNKSGDPLVVYEIRFYSVKNKLVLFLMRWMPQFSALMKNLK